MQKSLWIGGFLYHKRTNKILLQQKIDSAQATALWALFQADSLDGEKTPAHTFKKVVEKSLDVTIPLKKIQEVYSYSDDDLGKDFSIFYVEVPQVKIAPKGKEVVVEWFGFKEIQKLKLDPQSKHNLTVGQRVIDAKERKRTGQHTFE